jgi:hypothetical protein
MKQNIKKFLEFKGKNIYFLDIEGTYWIAVKPICEVLEVDYIRQFKNLKNDIILSGVLSNQTMHDTTNRLQNMVCLPEKYVYGWLFSIQSSSEKLKEYKKECYEILFDYFRGSFIQREKILEEKAVSLIKQKNLLEKLKETEEYKEYLKEKRKISSYTKAIADKDKEFIDQKITLFEQDFVTN